LRVDSPSKMPENQFIDDQNFQARIVMLHHWV
jgi:hypothetical protein